MSKPEPTDTELLDFLEAAQAQVDVSATFDAGDVEARYRVITNLGSFTATSLRVAIMAAKIKADKQ